MKCMPDNYIAYDGRNVDGQGYYDMRMSVKYE